ncbi:MAG: hypothetical protein ACI9ZF_001390 [Bradyrhizobium sp.]
MTIPITATLFELARRARQLDDSAALGFMAVNESHALAPYRQAALWLTEGGVAALSGVVQLEANAPYAQWLNRVCATLPVDSSQPVLTGPETLAPEVAGEWPDWLPAHGLWLPFVARAGKPAGGLLLARDLPWQEQELALLAEWIDSWRHAWQALYRPSPWTSRRWLAHLRPIPGTPWWRHKRIGWLAGVLLVLALPVRLSVLAPGELVPANPAVVRAPLDGVVGSFAVKPNQLVQRGQPLFALDDVTLSSKLEVATQAQTGAEAEYRQAAQLAVTDGKIKGRLALLTGKLAERRAETDYLRGQRERAHVVAPQDGIALFDDPVEWIGKPVVTGERILRLATPGDVEIEVWLPLADAIPLAAGTDVQLYLNASPLSPVAAKLRYMAHDAVQRPDGSYAYRVRATLSGSTTHRIGLKGSAKLSGERVALGYWILRRPLAALRQSVGF